MRRINPALTRPGERSHRFGKHDRLVIDGQSFRVDRKEKNSHLLQPMTGDLVAEDYRVVKTDAEINSLMKSKRIRIEEGYYSRVLSLIRVRYDDSDLTDLTDDELRTIAWKKEWCVRFLDASANLTAEWRPRRILDDYKRFVHENKAKMDRWYLKTFNERRKPGRNFRGEEPKEFDYPEPATLKAWMILYLDSGCRMHAFRPRYSNCGNRNQLDPRAADVISLLVKNFASRAQPKMSDICQDVELALEDLNTGKPQDQHVKASNNAVRRRIRRLDPIFVDAGRFGQDYALRKYTPVGRGLQGIRPFERVEIDDWEVDLMTLVVKSAFWKKLTPKQKKDVPRVRLTISIAIEVYTRTVVGLNVTTGSPSAATSKAVLRSVLTDKSKLAEFGECLGYWPMHFRPKYIATDGGPAFRTEFNDAARMVALSRQIPEQDPRMRGTVESFFKLLKRLCRYFAGQTFSDVVERGDYDSVERASLTVGQFHKAIIRFIVDDYHCRGHRGLEGRTPVEKWAQAVRENGGVPPPPSDRSLAIAFGLPVKPRPITKHGITVLGYSYVSAELAKLRGFVGNQRLKVFVEQEEAGRIWVQIPHNQRGRIPSIPADQHYLELHNEEIAGRLWAEILLTRKEVLAYAKAEQKAGRPFRLESHRAMLGLSDTAAKAAGIPADVITAELFNKLENACARKGIAGMSEIEYGDELAENNGFGELVAEASPRHDLAPDQDDTAVLSDDGSPNSAPPEIEHGAFESQPENKRVPFGGAMNSTGEDE